MQYFVSFESFEEFNYVSGRAYLEGFIISDDPIHEQR